jgi:hypothetical protein
MGTVYSTLFVGESISAGGSPAVIIPTGGQVAVLRDMRFLDFSATTGDQIQLLLQPVNRTAFVYTVGTPGNYVAEWTGRFVIPTGFTAEIISSTGTWNVFVSGYLLQP